jgi:uncharacterized membrane protein YjgN (DUF898 family)
MIPKYKLKSNLNIGSVVGQTLVWFLLSLVTLGLATPFFLYYFCRKVIDSIEIHEV